MPNPTGLRAYHGFIPGDGPPVCPAAPGAPRSHTLNANGGAIGLANCAMASAVERPFQPGAAPITPAQVCAFVREAARFCRLYDIPVTRWSVLTHAEIQPTFGIAQRWKWDITWLPGMPAPRRSDQGRRPPARDGARGTANPLIIRSQTMDSIKTIAPIFIAKTRSFWFGIVPTSLTAMDLAFTHLTGEGSVPVANALAHALQLVGLEWTGEQIAGFMQTLLPLYLVIFAHQRGTFSGAIPRPYTASRSKERAVIQTIEDGKSAFEAGKAFGDRLRRAGGVPSLLRTSALPPSKK